MLTPDARDLSEAELDYMSTDSERGLGHHVGIQDAGLLAHAVAEIRRHRAMVERMEELATKLETQPSDWPPIPRDAVAREIRNRMRGTNG